jgi:4-amino-4-deoxy-L-arabinose transferase-like glycosyltransferase
MLSITKYLDKKPWKYIQTIEFWIVLLFISRLENITIPPFDWDTWRQTLTMTIARNLYEVDANILFPRIDTGANGEGIFAGEFPIFNYLIFIFYKIFGYNDWFGRLINLTVSSAGMWFFYQIVKRLSSEKIAFYATLFYGVSVTFKYARKTMPDSFALSLVFMGVYFALLYLEKQRFRDITLCFLLTTLGLLSKMPSLCVLVFLIVPMLNQSIPLKTRTQLGLTLGVSVGIMSLWYFAWVPYLLDTYHNQLFWTSTLTEGWSIFLKLSDQAWLRFTDTAFGMKAGFIVSLMGFGALIINKQRTLIITIAVYTLVFFIFALKTGSVFPTHFYYIIPFTPVMSIAAGYFIAELTMPIWAKVIIAFLLLNVSNNIQRLDMFPPIEYDYLLKLEGIMDKYVPKNTLIMANGNAFNPTNHYFAHRKGWVVNNDVLFKKDWMPDYKKHGMAYIVIDKHLMADSLPYLRIFDDKDFSIYQP